MDCCSKKFYFGIILFAFVWVQNAVGNPTAEEQRDPDFVRASLLVTSASDNFYTAFGHASLRMECPVNHLDYVFTLATNPDSPAICLISGKQKSRLLCIETSQFLSDPELKGRSVVAYELNLKPQQEIVLWQQLDREVAENKMNRFNLNSNCVTGIVSMLTACVAPDTIRWPAWDKELALCNGELVRFYTQSQPWAAFLFMPLVGSKYFEHLPPTQRMDAIRLAERLQQAQLSTTFNAANPFLLNKQAEVLLQDDDANTKNSHSWVSPSLILWLVLMLVVVVSCIRCMGKIVDRLLLCLQSAIAVVLLATVLTSNVFGNGWNWYFIPYNLLPLFLWICFGRKAWFSNVYTLYVVVLLFFLFLTLWLPQLDWTHQLLTLAMLIRCFFNSSIYKCIRK